MGLVATLVSDSGVRWLKIPQKLLPALSPELANLPFELDFRTGTILRKTYLLADDWKIDDPDLICQFMPK
jgi:hypothetical protein